MYVITPTITLTASLYYGRLFTETNYLADIRYTIEGYKANPSLWDYSGGVTSLSSALSSNSRDVLRIARSKTDGAVYSSSNRTDVHLNTTASYQFFITASAQYLLPFTVSFYNINSGLSVYTSPTLYGDRGFLYNSFKFTPNTTASIMVVYNVPATTAQYRSRYLEITEPKLTQFYKQGNIHVNE